MQILRSLNEGNVCPHQMVLGYFDNYFFFFGYISCSLESCQHSYKEVVLVLFHRSHEYPLQRNGMAAIPNINKIIFLKKVPTSRWFPISLQEVSWNSDFKEHLSHKHRSKSPSRELWTNLVSCENEVR